MPRFVLLLHECPHDSPRLTHCDLMLETGESLETWALNELPHDWNSLSVRNGALKYAESNTVSVQRLADHRIAYLEYEGPISGDRGTVRRLDTGTCCSGEKPLTHELTGQLIHGQIELQQTPVTNQWQLAFTPAQS